MNKTHLVQYLQQYFNFTEFRNEQEEIICSVVDRNDTLIVMPTGGGKSLCFQLPALILPGTAIVISPLIALMKDQHDVLQDMNFPATYINSSLSLEESTNRLQRSLNGEYKLIYIAPERLENEYFINSLKKIKISFLAVDEAHCISEWGHDFRPAYLNIRNALKDVEISHIVALTATATPEVQKDIVKSLGMKNLKTYVIGFNRQELTYYTENLTNQEKVERIIHILKKTKNGSTIVYCGSRKKAEKIYNDVINNNFNATIYHAGLSDEIRKINQEKFINDNVKIIIATTAFGMGIDKQDVRNVIHTDLTSSVEQYYQEAGRAGRDGKPANCYLLYHIGDRKLQDFFIETAHPEKVKFVKVYDYLYSYHTQILNLTRDHIAVDVGINSHSVSYILKLLRSVGVLEKTLNDTKSRISFNRLNEESYSQLTDDEKYVLDSLQRFCNSSYQNNSSYQDKNYEILEFDENYFLSKYQITDIKLQRCLNSLVDKKIIRYSVPIPANSIVLLKEKTDIDKLGINFEHLEKHREFACYKLDKMLTYAVTNECKQNYILDYFADKKNVGACKKCTSCIQSPIDYNVEKFQCILGATAELNGKFGLWTLMQYLAGKSQADLYKEDMIKKYGLTKGKFYGKLRKEKDIRQLLDRCMVDGLLEKSTGKYPLISLTDKGLQALKKEVKAISTHLGNNFYQEEISHNTDNFYDTSNNYDTSNSVLNRIRNTIYSDNDDVIKKKTQTSQISIKRKIQNRLFNKNIISKSTINIEKANIENTSNLSLQSIECMFKSGLDIDEISQKLGVNNGKIAEILEDAIEKKLITNWQHYTNIATYMNVKNIISKWPGLNLRKVQSMLDIPLNYALLRIIVAFAKNVY